MARTATPSKNAPASRKAGKAAASVGIVEKAPAPVIVASSPVRNTPMPKAAAAPIAARSEVKAVTRDVTHDLIAARAREIHASGGGSDLDNWLRAERELRGV